MEDEEDLKSVLLTDLSRDIQGVSFKGVSSTISVPRGRSRGHVYGFGP